MATALFSIPPEILGPVEQSPPPQVTHGAGAARPGGGKSPPLRIRWRRADDTHGGEVEAGAVRSMSLEYPGRDGRMVSSSVHLPPAVDAEPPDDAVAVDILHGERMLATVPLRAMFKAPPKLPDPLIEMIGPSTASFVVPVFAERFTQSADFFDHVRSLRDWILLQPPFDRETNGDRLAFAAHFWPSDPARGLFDTRDERIIDGRLFFGDRDLAKTLLKRWIGEARLSLILINSSLRGGAGGQPGYSAWTSITPAPGERWEAVCLHEIGHGLGLADEYVDDQRAGEALPPTLEPNVARDPRPSAASWQRAVTVGDDPSPTGRIGAPPPAAADVVGTFQGARYRRDFYRPAFECLMQNTWQSFCPVCQDVIAERL